MGLTKDNKTEVIKRFQATKKDSGSAAVQIALLTERINKLTGHLQTMKKDKHSRVGLLRMVERRKKLLAYLSRTDQERYKKILSELEIRR
jgi:small subunit ribosomal protein S15